MSTEKQFSEDESFKLSLYERYEDLGSVERDIEHLRCVRCHEIAILFTITNCSHMLCRDCQAKLMSRTNQKCPKCKSILTQGQNKECKEFKKLTNRINKLNIKCLNHQFGCKYEDELSKMESHMKTCSRGSAIEEQIKDFVHENEDNDIRFTESEIKPDSSPENQETENPTVNETEKLISITSKNPKQLNILLVGATGNGKSTFINAFANYIKYDTLEEVIPSDVEITIPCNFKIWDGRNTRTVKLGSDSNEIFQTGQSCTQKCKIYNFKYQEHTFCFFDTPGVGDTRGLAQDKINLDQTLNVLAHFQYFHGIFMFLKPNESRLTLTLEYSIKQLLCQLPRKAKDNIFFIFTHARSTYYTPGETMDLVNAIFDQIKAQPPYIDVSINENNVFCLDNECFKFLAAVKNGVTFTPELRKINAKSWKQSRNQCKNLMIYMLDNCSETPSDIMETLCINQVRKAISDLTKPLAITTENIQDNLQVLRQHLKDIEECKSKRDNRRLKKLLYIPILKLKFKEFDAPSTICKADKCIQQDTAQHVTNKNFLQVCCTPCNCKKVHQNSDTDEQSLRFCKAFHKETGKCLKCSCAFSQHVQIYYESVIEEERLHDARWGIGLDNSAAMVIDNLKEKIKKLEQEEQLLTTNMVKLFIFLKIHAILTYNDAFEKYLAEIIENKKGQNKFEEAKRGIEEIKRNYIKEKVLMEMSVAAHTNEEEAVSIDEVLGIIKELCAMETSGEILARATNAYLHEQRIKLETVNKMGWAESVGLVAMLVAPALTALISPLTTIGGGIGASIFSGIARFF